MGAAGRRGPRGRDGPLRLRAEDRRRGDEPPLRGRPLRAGGDARRRPRRRGRHRQRGDDRVVPAQLRSAAAPCPRCSRSRRGVPAGGQLRAAERGRPRPPAAAVRQPAQRRRRQPAPEGPLDHRPARPVVLGVPARRGRRRAAARDAHETLDSWSALGFPVNPEVRSFDDLEAVDEHCSTGRSTATTSATRSTASSSRSTTSSSAPARLHVAGAALGDRLQVPARGAHDAAARHPGVDRAHRSGDAVRRARAGVRRRLDGRRGDAAQRGPGAGKDVRPGDTVIVRKAGDVIPEVVGPVLSMRPADSAVDVPDDVPVPAAQHARPARGRGRHAVRRAGVPVPA